ncbi:proline-rich protein 30 isoform X2 [Ornithorhynchus anatinus]|uniref:proline-rich protein 30 isoform X2 n=1 Tax=Ornithorhynchus anatinus TaxID=9258 RepID=UPI0010A7AFEF|nr:proline-rich protein 30 isoform X2 [Ornithorhynchus anatinus]
MGPERRPLPQEENLMNSGIFRFLLLWIILLIVFEIFLELRQKKRPLGPKTLKWKQRNQQFAIAFLGPTGELTSLIWGVLELLFLRLLCLLRRFSTLDSQNQQACPEERVPEQRPRKCKRKELESQSQLRLLGGAQPKPGPRFGCCTGVLPLSLAWHYLPSPGPAQNRSPQVLQLLSSEALQNPERHIETQVPSILDSPPSQAFLASEPPPSQVQSSGTNQLPLQIEPAPNLESNSSLSQMPPQAGDPQHEIAPSPLVPCPRQDQLPPLQPLPLSDSPLASPMGQEGLQYQSPEAGQQRGAYGCCACGEEPWEIGELQDLGDPTTLIASLVESLGRRRISRDLRLLLMQQLWSGRQEAAPILAYPVCLSCGQFQSPTTHLARRQPAARLLVFPQLQPWPPGQSLNSKTVRFKLCIGFGLRLRRKRVQVHSTPGMGETGAENSGPESPDGVFDNPTVAQSPHVSSSEPCWSATDSD